MRDEFREEMHGLADVRHVTTFINEIYPLWLKP